MGGRGMQLTSFDEAWRFACAVNQSGLAPKSLNRPESILIALQCGTELGFKPMQALSNIAAINGKPCLYGDGLKALVESSPACEGIQETVTGQGEAMVATCTAKRAGRAEATVRTFSAADAKRAGLWGKSGPWIQYPQRMLQMRARAWCLRDQFADLLCGIGVVEEQQDIVEEAPAPMANGTPSDASDLDVLADALGSEPEAQPEPESGPPTEADLVASGELVEDPAVGALFDTTPEPIGN